MKRRWPPDEAYVEEVFTRLARGMPEPKTELNWSMLLAS